LAESLKAKGDRTRLERVVRSKEDQQEILRLVREVSFAIEIAMVSLSSWISCVRTNTEPPLKFDVTIRNETLILQAVKGIDWLKDRHGEHLYFGFLYIVANLVARGRVQEYPGAHRTDGKGYCCTMQSGLSLIGSKDELEELT
jgi:hypothetical protein